LPHTLKFFAALGDLEAVRRTLDERPNDLGAVNDAFIAASRFGHETVASLLLDRSIALDPAFGADVDGRVGRVLFVKRFIENRPADAAALGLWKAFVVDDVRRAAEEGDVPEFVRRVRREPWLLGETGVAFQVGLMAWAALNGRADVIGAFLDLD